MKKKKKTTSIFLRAWSIDGIVSIFKVFGLCGIIYTKEKKIPVL